MTTPKRQNESDKERAAIIEMIQRLGSQLSTNGVHTLCQVAEKALIERIRELEATIIRKQHFPPRVRGYNEPHSIFFGDQHSVEEVAENREKDHQWRDEYIKLLDFVTAIDKYVMHTAAEEFGADMAKYFRQKNE